MEQHALGFALQTVHVQIPALQYMAEWSLNSNNRSWFTDDGSNTLPDYISTSIRNVNDLDRLVSLTGLIFIRWDITYNYLKSLRHTNRFGPLHSHFNSFVLQTINNALPTIDNLLKRLPQLYTGWSCLFCHRSDETLLHFSPAQVQIT